MSDNNSFLSNYGKDNGGEKKDVTPAKPFAYEQKSSFKKPERKEPRPPQSDDKKKRLMIALIAGGGALVVLIVLLLLLLGGGIEVLDFKGKKLSDAQLWANENGVNISTETAFSDTVDEGNVIEQDTPAGTRVSKGSFITLVVSKGHDLSVTLPLPDLMSMTADEVQSWADANFMTKVRITSEFSPDIAQGRVIRFEINDNTVVDEVRRDTPIYVIVSKGAEEAAATVKVPDFKTKSLAECYAFASENGITLTIDEQYDDYVPAGTIMSQSVKEDQMISKGSEIILVVSKGAMITVPNFSNYTKEQATALAAELGLPVTITEKYSSSSAGRLISQSIAAGSIYNSGDLLELNYSLGNSIVVASYVGQTRDTLESWAKELNELGAKLSIKATEAKSSHPRGTIIYQDKANMSVGYRTTINITVSAGKVVYVPDFTGPGDANYNNAITREKAIAMCEEVGLIPVFVKDATGGVLAGEIWSQSLKPGTEVSEGTTITLLYKPTGTVTVPNFIGKSKEVALSAKYVNKLTIIIVDEGGTVVTSQTLSAESTVAAGSTITLTLGSDSGPTTTSPSGT